MTEVVAFDDVKNSNRIRKDRPDGHFYTTQFIDHSSERHGAPNVFMIESSQNRVLDTHFHDVDQFQIVRMPKCLMSPAHTLSAAGRADFVAGTRTCGCPLDVLPAHDDAHVREQPRSLPTYRAYCGSGRCSP